MATTPELLTAERAEPSRRSAGVALRGSGMPLMLVVLVAARALTPLPVAWLAVLIGLACAVTGLGRRGSAPAAGRSPGSPRTTMTVADRATSTPRA